MSSIIRIAILVAVSAAVGAAYAAARNLPWKPNLQDVAKKLERNAAVSKEHERLRNTAGMTLDELRAHIAQGGVVIDARPKEEFEKAHLKLDTQPPVLNVEPHDVMRHLSRLQPLMGQPIAIYCTSLTCELGEELFIELERNQFFGMKIYFPGWEGIQQAGLPTASGPDVWTTDPSTDVEEAPPQPVEEGETP